MDDATPAPTPAPATPQRSGTPYWMEWVRTVAVAVLGIASLAVSIFTYRMQKDNGEQQLATAQKQIDAGLLQIETQQATLAFQRQVAAAQLAANVIGHLGCKGDERQEIALAFISATAPQHLREITPALLNCRSKRISAGKLNELGSIAEIRVNFRQQLEMAQEYLRHGYKEAAARHYLDACNWIPDDTPIDRGKLDDARNAFAEQRYPQAVDLFREVFRNVSTF